MIPFGQILQRLRSEKRWSQSKLAEKLGLSASQVANYEMGRRLPSLQILIDMARILGVSTDYLLGVENETKQILDVSDLTSEEISSVSSVIDCFRKSHQKSCVAHSLSDRKQYHLPREDALCGILT